VVIPSHAGVGSAVGFLRAPVAYEVVRSLYQRLSTLHVAEINRLFAAMTDEAGTVVAEAAPGRETHAERSAFMRYVGQAHEIEVALPVRDYGAGDPARIRDLFEAEYRRLFNRLVPGIDIEAMSWKVEVSIVEPPTERRAMAAAGAVPQPLAHRPLFEPAKGAYVQAPNYRRDRLPPGARIAGPAVIEEDETSTVLTGNYDAVVHDWAIVLTRRNGERR
jgi:N-methylhydantoinase A